MTSDELTFRMAEALKRHRLRGWELIFAKSIVARSRRRGWGPTERQLIAMQNIVSNLRARGSSFAGEDDLIDHADT